MSMFKNQIWLTISVLLTLTACDIDGPTLPTSIDVFDGAAIECKVSWNGIIATEVGNGAYQFNPPIPMGVVVAANGCLDSDTGSELPELLGVSVTQETQGNAAVISPITKLIVEAAISQDVSASGATSSRIRSGEITISTAVLESVTSSVVERLGLSDYKPTDPKTANYIALAKDDLTGSQPESKVMRTSLALSALFKIIEISADSADAEVVISEFSEAIAASGLPIDLGVETDVDLLMATVKSNVPVGSAARQAIDLTEAAIIKIVPVISNAMGHIDTAIAAAKTAAVFLNTATKTTVSSASKLDVVIADAKQEITIAAAKITTACTFGVSVLGACTL